MRATVKHACGHEETYDLYGPRPERERKMWALGQQDCPACRAKRVASWEAERGAPPLEGTEKQKEWAARIRMETMQGRLKAPGWADREDLPYYEAAPGMLLKEDRASWWIDHRDDPLGAMAKELRKAAEEADSEEAAAVVVMSGDGAKEGPVCFVGASGRKVSLSSGYDLEVTEVAKKMGLRWNGSAWFREVPAWAGSPEDRAAELCHALLGAGFPVAAPEAVREKVEAGTWERECRRWVLPDRKNPANVVLVWEKGNRGLQLEACRVPGSSVYERSATVPATEKAAVEDFAEMHGFAIDGKARERMDGASRVKVVPKAPAPAPGGAEEALRDILESPRDILDDLLEEDD